MTGLYLGYIQDIAELAPLLSRAKSTGQGSTAGLLIVPPEACQAQTRSARSSIGLRLRPRGDGILRSAKVLISTTIDQCAGRCRGSFIPLYGGLRGPGTCEGIEPPDRLHMLCCGAAGEALHSDVRSLRLLAVI